MAGGIDTRHSALWCATEVRLGAGYAAQPMTSACLSVITTTAETSIACLLRFTISLQPPRTVGPQGMQNSGISPLVQAFIFVQLAHALPLDHACTSDSRQVSHLPRHQTGQLPNWSTRLQDGQHHTYNRYVYSVPCPVADTFGYGFVLPSTVSVIDVDGRSVCWEHNSHLL